MLRSALLTTALSLSALSLVLPSATGSAQDSPYSPYVDRPSTRLLWGDTHLHSSMSTDAFGFGVTLDPEQAFRFASGETVTSTHGEKARLRRPLDFVLLSDHAESLGMMNLVAAGDPRLIKDPVVKRWHEQYHGEAAERQALQRMFLGDKERMGAFQRLDGLSTEALSLDIWQQQVATAERFNRPGKFSTLLGYEWTLAPGGSNLHRVVMFRDGPEQVARVAPLSAYESTDPATLWKHLASYEETTGGKVLAIPHNGNLSNGIMFRDTMNDGSPMSREYAKTRARWEPIVEVTQIKGDGEAHPLLSPDDEFADYETWDFGNFAGVPKTPDMLKYEYAREALKTGLALQRSLGANPYRFGMVGSTDSHTALTTAEEDNFFGKHSRVEPSPERETRPVGKAGDLIVRGWQMASSGYAAVWAQDNTRASIFDAIARREVYASTCPRISLRFFGGWEFTQTDADAADIAAAGYAKGVPMGGVLADPQSSEAPSFLLAVLKDPLGANLDRVQIVKGWVDDSGKTHELVYNVAWAGSRDLDAAGQLTPIGSTVDVEEASWQNSIGAAELRSVWRDPDFQADQDAFYYARVLEIPTPRWTAYDRKRFAGGAGQAGEANNDENVPMTTQERAYSSPIWYTP
ncbi:MAG: DUF3604 domain-containing protein [Congregibacter sp.]